MKTRLVVRAVIQRDSDVLVNMTKRGPRLLGGRVRPREPLAAALARELDEEIGLKITVRDLVMVRERIKHSVREVTFVYRCYAFGDLENVRGREKHITPRWVPRATVVNWTRPAVFLAAG